MLSSLDILYIVLFLWQSKDEHLYFYILAVTFPDDSNEGDSLSHDHRGKKEEFNGYYQLHYRTFHHIKLKNTIFPDIQILKLTPFQKNLPRYYLRCLWSY